MASRINDFEHEILLSRGTKFQVLGVRDLAEGAFKKEIDLMIIGQDKLPAFKKVNTSKEADIWDEMEWDF